MGKITKKRNDLKFCNDLPCNDLYVSTVHCSYIIRIQYNTICPISIFGFCSKFILFSIQIFWPDFYSVSCISQNFSTVYEVHLFEEDIEYLRSQLVKILGNVTDKIEHQLTFIEQSISVIALKHDLDNLRSSQKDEIGDTGKTVLDDDLEFKIS